jgi:Mrp family chromosome partitioning ATPase
VISHAPVPLAPSTPSRFFVVAAAIPAGLLLGLMFALIAERMAAAPVRVRYAALIPPRPAEPMRVAEPILPAPPIVADVPNACDRKSADVIVDWPRSAFALSITGLAQRLSQQPGRVVVLAPADGSRMATSIGTALVRAAALMGKRAVLVDGELKRPVAGVEMGLPPAMHGLVEALSGRVALSQAFQVDPRSSALVLPCTKSIGEPSDVFSTPVFAELLTHLRRNCDLVVIPARLREVHALAAQVDGVLLVVPKARMHRAEVLVAVRDIARQGGKAALILAG